MKMIHIERIIFTDGSTLSDKNAAIVDGFLVIDQEPPKWINTNEVSFLEGVTINQKQMRIS